MSNYVKFDTQASLREARARMPLTLVIEQSGHGPRNGKWKSFACPFCGKKNKAGVFNHEGIELFKCQSTSCPTGAKAMDAVGYLATVHGRSRSDACMDYLKMAGVWQDRARFVPPRPAPESAQPAATFPELSPATPETSETPAPAVSLDSTPAPPAGGIPPAAVTTPAAGGATSEASEETAESLEEVTEERCREALCEFYGQLTLNERDEQHLFDKRAIPSRLAERLGFKSNTKANLEILLAMADRFPMAVLQASGLWKKDEHGLRPEAQFHGWGRGGDGEWTWTEPILIPYFSTDGDLIHLRPHKGGIKGKPAHVYVPRKGGEVVVERYEHVLITEGEFKAAAVVRTLPDGWCVGALPGIQMFRNYNLGSELEEWIRSTGARHVGIVYDNEEKGDPALPGYKDDPKKRYDASIWAKVLAGELADALHLRVEVADLPKEMRDEKGKADWDGALATFHNK